MKDLSEISIQYLKGVGPARKKLFLQLGVETVEGLLYFFPRRYEDRRQMTALSQLKVGENQTVAGRIVKFDDRQAWYTKKHVCEIVVGDQSGELTAVWFNQPYLAQYFKLGMHIVLYGKVEVYKERRQMVAPEYEILGDEEDESLSIGRIVPIYPLTRGMSQRYLRKIIHFALWHFAHTLKEVLPYGLREKQNLLNLVKSLNNLHFPEDLEIQKEAFKRIAFEEFFLFQISVTLRRLSVVQKEGIAHPVDDFFVEEFCKSFPFELTVSQRKTIAEIAADMAKNCPMHRLLQGDVGSGKTLVAFFGCAAAIRNGYQAAIMTPTEILAKQHFDALSEMMTYAPFKKIRIALLVGSLSKKEKDAAYKKIKEGEIDLIVGTHTLIQQDLDFKNLSFVVIDEQHKFGVRQRSLLTAKGRNPDTLIMTATPIPRTLCLTLYGDLDISILKELPAGRGTVKTRLYQNEDAAQAYELVRNLVKGGQQAYIIYPIVEESAKLDLKAAEEMFKQLREGEFNDLRLGLVHGQMKQKTAQKIMDDFKEKKIDILIATTILEVGIDVPNANVMVIEHAERFGLSQLHQLRGRIGRGRSDAVCILISTPTTPESQVRLQAILSTTDGFKIAEQDLLIRGPGEFFGRHQHGLNELKIANPITQLDILEMARKEAIALTEKDAALTNAAHTGIKNLIERRYPAYLEMAAAG